ncbi:MAG: Cfr10I/Bse634I family restriction endonuclease [Bacteroidetes bacterium]|nr:Cfr10I/Bse634I family restriction endonuclease [Bacteroidota bacterium]
MPYIRNLGNGGYQVIKDEAFFHLLNGNLPEATKSLSVLFTELDTAIRDREPSITTGALSNVHGDWYEWLLAITAWNHFCLNQNSHLAILMPNISQFDVARLYEPTINATIEDLRTKVQESSGVRLITSNPDFVIIDGNLARQLLPEINAHQNFDTNSLNFLETLYTHFIGRCNFYQIIGYASVKASLRPDRRLQIAHEGSLMKAIYTHLQTRQWILNPPGLKYYAISTRITDPDRVALKTVATHSITIVSSIPQAAVDDVFEVNSLQQAQVAFEEILNA